MARSYDASKAEQVRKHYRESRFVAVDLRPPALVDGIPGDADGLMPHDKVSAPLEIEIPLFSDRHGFVPNLLTVEWLPASSSEYLLVFEEDVPGSVTLPDDQFPLRRQLPLSLFQNYEGKFEFHYRVRNWNDHTIERESPPAPVTIDRIGPVRPATPEAIVGVPALVTSDILTRDGGVKCEIPDFTEDKKEFVRVVVGLMDKPPESAAEFPALVVIDELLDPSRQILIPERFITAIGSKLQYLVYYLYDKAGNRSERSYDRSIQVALGELPSGLSPCEVPLADDDGFIDRADGVMPVKVHIPEYTGWQTTDGIVIEFGNQVLARTSVGGHLEFPLKITIPWGRVSAAYDFLAGGAQDIQVDYRVFRGDFPVRSPAPTSATLILELPGPENPNPEPINPVLDVIRFLSFRGSDSELTIGDIDEHATAFFKLPDNVVANDVFTITYNNRVISSAPYIVNGSETPNQEVSRSIPWDDIKLTPVMTGLEMFYTFTRPGFVNPQESRRTAIDVLVEVVDLPEPIFPRAVNLGGGYKIFNCTSLEEGSGVWGVKVHIPASNYLKEGVWVKFHWQTYGPDGTTPLPDTTIEEERQVSLAEESAGMDWFVAYDTYLKPTYVPGTSSSGEGKAMYSLPVRGVDESSEWEDVIIGVFESTGSGNDHCVIPRP
ncbi:hypothetical protein C1886_21150 [Pseudomonas sp. FW300-N1A1]|uniref:hypothetical protein n=1 Tax=Pseudomonas sp. FW300-N1A1 TaxID=2075555 RepID=UPI000CD2726D|nr:hypothetical protein [Pseudomonas sp. FW300-N1A1]POA17607.1 hypothetical protein C1886_21150 [Pseudomonas sp. FW300-N1A1]